MFRKKMSSSVKYTALAFISFSSRTNRKSDKLKKRIALEGIIDSKAGRG